MTKEEFYTKWQPNGFYAHNPVEFITDLESVIKTEQSRQADVSGSLPKTMKQLKALLFTAYLVGRDDEQKGGRSFTDWFEDVVERQ